MTIPRIAIRSALVIAGAAVVVVVTSTAQPSRPLDPPQVPGVTAAAVRTVADTEDLLELQQEIQGQSQLAAAVESLQRLRHETIKSIINNLR